MFWWKSNNVQAAENTIHISYRMLGDTKNTLIQHFNRIALKLSSPCEKEWEIRSGIKTCNLQTCIVCAKESSKGLEVYYE